MALWKAQSPEAHIVEVRERPAVLDNHGAHVRRRRWHLHIQHIGEVAFQAIFDGGGGKPPAAGHQVLDGGGQVRANGESNGGGGGVGFYQGVGGRIEQVVGDAAGWAGIPGEFDI